MENIENQAKTVYFFLKDVYNNKAKHNLGVFWIRLPVGEKISIFHFDMYRIKDEDDLISTGFYDYEERGGIIITEWSENIPFAIPEKAVRVNIEKISETARRFTIC